MTTPTGYRAPSKTGYLNLAAEFAAEAWFPGVPDVARRAAEALAGSPSRDELIALIRGDISLLTLTTLELYNAESSAVEPFDGAPLEIIRRADPATLATILERAKGHGMPCSDAIAPEQSSCLRHAIVSASAAEVLAPAFDAERDTAYTCALMRRLGTLLIAWNYPQVYRRALSLVRSDTSLDGIISKIIGFSPLTLGLTVAQRRNVPPEILRGMGDQTVYSRAKHGALATGDRLRDLCTLGEGIAETFDPLTFPETVPRAAMIRATFEQRAGRACLARLQATLAANARIYLEITPPMVILPPQLDPYRDGAPTMPPASCARNPFVVHCPSSLWDIFAAAYSKLGRGRSEANTQAIFQSLAPSLGFKSGCIYIFDPLSELLKPRYTAGDRRPIDYRPVSPAEPRADPVGTVFAQPFPGGALRDGGTITGTLGASRPVGVVSLTLGPELRGLSAAELELLFAALRRTIEDCLDLPA
jgi:hypothetical protein